MGFTCAAYLHSANLHSCTFDSHDVDNLQHAAFLQTKSCSVEFDNISSRVEFYNSSFIVCFLTAC